MNLLTLHFINNHILVTWSPGMFKIQTAITVGFLSCKNLSKVGVMKKRNSEWGIWPTWDSFYCGTRFSITILSSEQTCSTKSEKFWLWGILPLENSAKYVSHFPYFLLCDTMNSTTGLQLSWLPIDICKWNRWKSI